MNNDKRNILGSLMPRQQQQHNKENSTVNIDLLRGNKQQMQTTSNRPNSGASSVASSSRQHKLKQRFNVIRKLGKGTYGKVQLAINKETGQEVAIKTIKKTKIENEQDLQRVRREIQIMSSIEHPHIIHIYEVFENKDKIVLVMQYAPGGELYEHVSQAKVLDDGEARRLFRQIATAIYYCHENKICHRDLKLENILLDEKNNAKLADFGLSNVFDKRRQLKTFCGSPLYASPEIVQGSPYEGPEVDCWSLGVLLYTLVYGAMPFDGSNFKRLVKQISEASYFEPKQKSQASPLIRQLLCADPLKRATIIDICTDSWVNGASPRMELTTTTITNEEQPVQSHHSLLKIAQDMASLTPVRFDILLALAPTSPSVKSNIEQTRHPLSPMVVNQQDRVSEKPPRPAVQIALDPSVMIVNQERSTSPVASYIVRDLMVESEPKPEGDACSKLDLAEVSVADTTLLETTVARGPRDELVDDNSDEAIGLKDPRREPEEEQQVGELLNKQEETMKDQQVESATEEQQDAEMETKDEHSTSDNSDITKESSHREELHAKKIETHLVEANNEADITMEVDEQPEACPTSDLDISERNADIEQQQQPQVTEVPKDDVEKENEEKPIGDKPKKVKKKIVVVRKKKKVQNKEVLDGGELANEENNETRLQATTGEKESSNKGNILEKKKVSKPKGPGRVRIPNTFQAPSEVPPSPSEKSSQETRRPSTLIADVSQKLLQQQGLISGSAAVIRTDQPQLVNVKVSDKKSEFERRASLASANSVQANSGLATDKDPLQCDEIVQCEMEEPQRLECLQESVRLLEALEQTIVEPVNKREPLQVSSAKQVSMRPLDELVESQTPTADGSKVVDPIQIAEMERRLANWASKLDERKTNDEARKSSGSPRDDRSDSVETIKAESSPIGQKSIRSSLQINMGDKPEDRTIAITSPQSAIGPTPITRSYKKVIFTKDGACITETGKIYSTQADDGTVKRVERKSKITHYPANEDNPNAKARSAIEETEERIISEDGGIAQVKQSTQSYSSSGLLSGRPFERLIMPSSGLILDDDEDLFMQQTSFSPRHSTQIGRADSGSSCSSGSTDVFDDIFDTWTGTISMFQKQKRSSLAKLHDSMLNRAFGGDSIFRTTHRQRRVSNSAAGTPRCESVEPQQVTTSSTNRRRNGGTFGKSPSGEYSGYESDAPIERPASALSGARGLFGSGNLFQDRPLTSGKTPDLLHNIEREHDRLRKRITEQHKHFWKGSTPSLFSGSGQSDSMSHLEQEQSNQRRGHKSPQGLWKFLRPEESLDLLEGCERGRRLSPGSQTSSLQQQQHVWPRKQQQDTNNLNQSQSSSSFLRQSIALSATPTRKNTAVLPENLPPQPIRRTISKSSLITSQSSDLASSGIRQQMDQKQHTASFIELKRTNSSAIQQQQQYSEQVKTNTSSHGVVSTSGSSSAFWEGRLTPESSSTNAKLTDQEQTLEPESRGNVDSRIQDWLLESAGNLSNSSGCKSVASETMQAYKNNDPFSSQCASPKLTRENLSPKLATLLLPTSPSKSSSLIEQQNDTESSQASHSTSSTMIVSSSKRSSSNQLGNKQQQEEEIVHSSIATSSLIGFDDQSAAAADTSASKVSKATFILRQKSPSKPEIAIRQQELVSSSTSISKLASSPLENERKSEQGLSWTSNEQPATRLLCDELEDSLSGCSGSGELESRSSSSLLDQLRSRGYRSMINQRMGGDNHSTAQVSSSEEATSVIESSSRVVSTSGSRIIHHQIQTSSSSSVRNATENKEQSEYIDVVSDGEKSILGLEQTTKPDETNSLENTETVEQVAIDTKDKGEEEEEEDEDVREAKLNIKAYRDRVKETELFLKSMQQEEEKMEQQRKELFLFNNLMLSSKLNCFKVKPFGERSSTQLLNDGSDCISHLTAGYRSAPIQTTEFNQITSNIFIPSAALSFEPTMHMNPSYTSPYVASTVASSQHQDQASWRPARDPLEPVEPISINSNYLSRFNRSKSQLSDQFSSTYNNKRGPISASLEQYNSTANPYFPSRKRSLSQIRSSSYYTEIPPEESDTFSRTIGGSRTKMMSEYKSAYCNISNDNRGSSSHLNVSSSSRLEATSPVESLKTDGTDESDDGMSAYRVSSYVPKVVPQTTQMRGRSYQRRSEPPLDKTPLIEPVEVQSTSSRDEKEVEKRQRHISLHSRVSTKDTEYAKDTMRRRSLIENSSIGSKQTNFGESSRLDELEQRIQANKKRREELLAGKLSPDLRCKEQRSSVMEEPLVESTREVSPVSAARSSRLTRPSRLESMEARIKRKSYCVKPETSLYQQGQQSLEKWRQNLLSNRRSSTSSPRNSISGLDSRTLLANLERRQEVNNKGDKEQTNERLRVSGLPPAIETVAVAAASSSKLRDNQQVESLEQ